jgi:NAD(P)H-binding
VRVFVAGASGVIGVRLLPLLVAAGHDVAGMTRSEEKADMVRDLGGEPVVCDVFDAEHLLAAVTAFAPDVVVHQLTDLPGDPAQIAAKAPANARIRREGTRNLLSAAEAARASSFLAQSIAWQLPREPGSAVDELEEAVLGAGGVVLRYGQFYGPGTYYEGAKPDPPRIQVDRAASLTVSALMAPSGILTMTDE